MFFFNLTSPWQIVKTLSKKSYFLANIKRLILLLNYLNN